MQLEGLKNDERDQMQVAVFCGAARDLRYLRFDHRVGAMTDAFVAQCQLVYDRLQIKIEEKTRNGNLRTLSGSGQFLRTGPQRPELIWTERWRGLPVVYVTDFLNMGVGPIRTGIFNLAYVALMAGMVLLVLQQRRSERLHDPRRSA